MPMAAAIPAIISGGFSLGSALLGNRSVNKAQQAQIDAQNQRIANTQQAVAEGQQLVNDAAAGADAILTDSSDRATKFYDRYIDVGNRSLADLETLTGAASPLNEQFKFTREDLDNDPGFQFTLKQGLDAIARSQAARGGLFSSNTLDSQALFAMDAGNQYFNDAFTRAKTTFDTNRKGSLDRIASLQDLAKMGYAGSTAAADTTASTGVRRAGVLTDAGRTNAGLVVGGARDVNQAVDDIGDINASGTMARGNNWQNVISNASKGINDILAARKAKNSTV